MDNTQPVWRRAVDCFFNLINGVAWVFFVLMIAVMLVQVFTRYVFNHPLPWTEEASRFSYIWAIFLGSVIAQRAGSHMTVTIVSDKLPAGVKKALNVIISLFSAVVLGIVFYGTLGQMKRNYGILASSIPISYTYIYLALAIGAGLMIVLLLVSFVKDLRALFASRTES